MEEVPCNLCGSDRHRPVYRVPAARRRFGRLSVEDKYFMDSWLTTVECEGCGLGFVNPRPDRQEIAAYYNPEFYEYFNDDTSYHANRYRIEGEFLDGVSAPAGRKPSLLDVGCANGDFPRYMKGRGWEVAGVEVSANAAKISDFEVYSTEFSRIPVAGPTYDAVTAWAVLEHVHDPMAYFRKAFEVLRPGGRFVFLVTNFASLSSRALFREDVPRHLYFFTEPTVRRYLETVGLRLARVECGDTVYTMRPSNWLRYLLLKHVARREMEWKDIPEIRIEYFARLGLQGGVLPTVRYVATHPLATVDRLLLPLFERYQLATGSYGITTFVAEKPL